MFDSGYNPVSPELILEITKVINYNSIGTTFDTTFEKLKLNNGYIWHHMAFRCENMDHKIFKKI